MLVCGCAAERSAELASLEDLSPLELEVGETLNIAGNGFIVGDATLILEGTFSAPGRAGNGETTQLALPVLATSPTRAVARISRRHIERLGAAHITFSGRAVLRFESAAGPDAPPVAATREDVRLELFASNIMHHSASQRALERGSEVLRELGVTGSVLPEGRGILIEQILSSSVGARAGLRPGEIIVSAGNVTVTSVSDLAPPPRHDHIVIGLRTTDGGFRRVSCPLSYQRDSLDQDRVAAFTIASCALLLLLVAAGPLRGVASWSGRQISGRGFGPRSLLAQVAITSRERPITSSLWMMIFAAAPFVFMALVHLGLVLLAGSVLLASLLLALTSTRGWRRLIAAPLAILRILPLVMLTAAAAVHSTSMEITQIVGAQGVRPWEWLALGDPASLALLLVVIAVTCSGEDGRPRAMTALYRGLAGALVAATVLGGWSSPSESALWGQVLFASKAWLVGLLFVYGGRSRYFVTLPIAAALLAAIIALAVLPLPPWISVAAPWVAGTAALLLVAPLALRHVFRGPAPSAHPGAPATQRVTENPPLPSHLKVIPGHS